MGLRCNRCRTGTLVTDYITELALAIRSRVPLEDAPSTSDDLRLFRIYAVLALAKGDHVTTEDVHNAWSAWMAERDVTHDSLVPFGLLSKQKQALDAPVVQAIREAAIVHRLRVEYSDQP